MLNKNTINEIKNWLRNSIGIRSKYLEYNDSYNIEDLFTITNNGVIECLDDSIAYIYLKNSVTNFPYKFGRINCGLNCDYSHIVSLNNFPIEVNGEFSCYKCENLISLKGSPKIVKDSFYCSCTNIKTLEGSPIYVGEDFRCSSCDKLTSLKGSPKYIGGSFMCFNCSSLIDLNGSPKYVIRNFNCRECKNLTSLEGLPIFIGNDFDYSKCKNLKDLDRLYDNDKLKNLKYEFVEI